MKAKLIISGSIHRTVRKRESKHRPDHDKKGVHFTTSHSSSFPRCQVKRETEATGLEWGI